MDILSQGAVGGTITLNSGGDISLTSSFIDNRSFNSTPLDMKPTGGDINITANSLLLSELSRINASTEGFANAGDVNINVSGKAKIDFSGIYSRVNIDGVGDAGNLNINLGSLEVTDGSNLQSRTLGQGNAGDINITARDEVKFAGIRDGYVAFAESGVRDGAVGDAGDINIKVTNGSLNIEDSAALSTRTWGDGNAGNVNIDVSDNVKIDFADIFSSVISQNGNQAGDININANSVEVVNGSSVGSSIFGIGNAGNININATNKVRIDGLSSDGEFRSSISADVSNIIENSEGNGGNIKIETQLFDMNDGLLSVGNSGIGNPGNINIHTDTISLNSSSIRASAFSENAGNVNLQASGDVSLKDSLISTSLFFGNGKGGDITIDAKSLFLTDFSSLGGFQGSDTTSEGSAGNITVKTDEFVTLDNSSSISVSANRGFGGEILIDTKKLSVQNGSQITANVLGDKPAASLTVNATESVEVSGFANSLESALSIRTSGDGDAGTLTINTGKLIVKDGASISTSGSVLFSDLPEQLLNDLQASQLNIGGAGKGGNLEINASESVQIIGSTPDGLALSSLVSNGEGGDGGKIKINTPKLTVTDGAEIIASTVGEGKGGTIEINAPLSVEVTGTHPTFNSIRSIIRTDSIPSSTGKAGDIKINTPQLKVTDEAEISAVTGGKGEGGTIDINSQSISLNSGRIWSSTTGEAKAGTIDINSQSIFLNTGLILSETFGEAKAGTIDINSQSISLNSGFISSSTYGEGEGGKIDINSKSISLSRGIISSSTLGDGKAGEINLTADTLEVANRSQITTSTFSSGKAGDITLTVKDNITLTGENTGISSNTRESSTGDGGKIIIDPILFTIEDGAAIAVNSQGTGIGGDIELTADTLNLDNGTINARTRSNTGGNITLTVDDILYMRRNSKISTTAGNEQFGGNGGNITINTPFIVAFPTNGDGNDITANAFLGNGGNVNITGQFLFGIESRDQLTTFNDITASSELAQDGTVEVNTPGIDPTRSLIQLPDGRINPQVSQNCQANGRGTKAEFYPIGTGGLPHNPESLSIPEPFNQGLIPLQLEQKNTPKLSIGKTQSQNNIELNKKESSIYTETLPCQQR